MSEYSFIAVFWKLFFLLTPFFVLSMFVTVTEKYSVRARRMLALRTTLAALATCLVVFFFGEMIFNLMGITLDAFRIGAGIVLLLTGIQLVNDSGSRSLDNVDADRDIAVVPLAIPYTIGPGTIGVLLVMSAGTKSLPLGELCGVLGGMVCAIAAVGGMLYASNSLERLLKRKGMQILSKITGLVLAALASQMIFTGIAAFLRGEV